MTSPLFLVIVELEYEGKWVAEIIHFPGALSYGRNRNEAIFNVFNIAREVRESGDVELWCE